MALTFALSTDEGGLHSFASQAEAISYAEGIDVEDGTWRFFSSDGVELQPVFTSPNQEGRFVVCSGTYVLVPASGASPVLKELVAQIRSYEGLIGSRAELIATLNMSGSADRDG